MVRSLSALLSVALLLMMGIASCGGGGNELEPGDQDPDPAELVPEVQIQVVDHNYRVAGWTDENLDNHPIFALIASANSSLDIAVTRINRQEVVEALLAEASSGTQIRIVTEKAYYDAPNYQPFYAQLEDPAANGGNIVIRTDNEGLPRLMHARFMIIDQARVITGSHNWETVNEDHTIGDVISITNTAVAAAFANQFNQMFIEGNFGVDKRDDTQHSFLLGSGNGLLEVYFGPTDRPRDLMETEIGQSAHVILAVQQFKDFHLAQTLLDWVGANPMNRLVALINDHGPLGDAEENAVYEAMYGYVEAPTGGELYLGAMIDETGVFNEFAVMNHKLMLVDHAYTNGIPGLMFTTSNYSDLGFTLNDEVMLIMRGGSLIAKYWRGGAYAGGTPFLMRSLPPDEVQEADDFQEFDQLAVMYPHFMSVGAEQIRPFNGLPAGIIFGDVGSFRRTITIQTQDGGFEDVDIDLAFEIEGDLFFGGTLPPTAPFGEDADPFVENELLNPDHRYMMVVPAGEIIVRTIVVDDEGTASDLFQPAEEEVFIGPGCVKKVGLSINQAAAAPGGGGGGGAGGGA